MSGSWVDWLWAGLFGLLIGLAVIHHLNGGDSDSGSGCGGCGGD